MTATQSFPTSEGPLLHAERCFAPPLNQGPTRRRAKCPKMFQTQYPESRISAQFPGGSMIFIGNPPEIRIFQPTLVSQRPPPRLALCSPACDSCTRKTTCPFSVSASKACGSANRGIMGSGVPSSELTSVWKLSIFNR